MTLQVKGRYFLKEVESITAGIARFKRYNPHLLGL